jgi:hypothetical protein
MILSEAGKVAESCWLSIPQHFPNVVLHEFAIMPDHIHGVLEITGLSSSKIDSVQSSENPSVGQEYPSVHESFAQTINSSTIAKNISV